MFFIPSLVPGLAAYTEPPPGPEGGGNPNLQHNGLWVGQTFFGRGGGNYPVRTNSFTYRFRAERTGTIDRIGLNCPVRPGYWDGDGGIMRMEIYRAGSNGQSLTEGGTLLYTHPDIVAPDKVRGGGNPLLERYGTGNQELCRHNLQSNVLLIQGDIYFIVWRNVGNDPANNYFSINNMHANDSYVTMPPWNPTHYYNVWAAMTGSPLGTSWTFRTPWCPFLQIRYTDGTRVGWSYIDGGRSSAVTQVGQAFADNSSSREIGGNNQSRQRFQLSAGYGNTTIDQIHMRIWRRTSEIGGVLRITLEREDAGGGVTTLLTVDVAASSLFQTGSEGVDARFDNLVLNIADTVLSPNVWYRLRVHSTGSAIFAMRALGQTPDSADREKWTPGRAEYTEDGGASWRGMHSWGIDNRSDYSWNMGMRVKAAG